MRKAAAFKSWLLLAAFIVLDRVATVHPLPEHLQDAWTTYMSGLSPFAHWALAAVMLVLVYLYWPLLKRLIPASIRSEGTPPSPNSSHFPNESNWLGREEAAQFIYDNLTSGRFNDQGQIIQATRAIGKDSADLWEHVGAWLVDGVKS